MLDRDKLSQYGQPRKGEWLGITIHNTSNNLTAKEMFDYLNNDCKTSQGCHYFVDETEAVKVMPLNWITWHTGKGEDIGNMKTIAIEICRSQGDEETFKKAMANAVKLTKELMEKYGFDTSRIFFHIEFNERTYCPHRILDLYGNKAEWLKENFYDSNIM